MNTAMIMDRLYLAWEVLKSWEVLASIGALIVVASLLGMIANPKEYKPRSGGPKAKPAPKAAKEAKPAAAEAEEDDSEPEGERPRRASLASDDEE